MMAGRGWPRLPAAAYPITGLALALALAACGDTERPQTGAIAQASELRMDDPERPPLTPEGWGQVRIGMTLEQVTDVAGPDANPHLVGGPEPEACDEFRPERAPAGMILMLERGVLTRISLGAGSEVQTERGLRVGTPAAAVREAYGDLAVASPHKYISAPAEYLTVAGSPGEGGDPRGIVYEVGNDGRVSRIHAGGPSIHYVEGCL